MSVNLAALADAADCLGAAAESAAAGHTGEARFAADRACGYAREAFGVSAEHPETGAFDMVVAAVIAELPVTP